MPICYHVPGVLGTRLYRDEQLTRLVWVDQLEVVIGGVGALRLADDGIAPGPPDGVPLFPGGSLPDYYGECIQTLRTGLAGSGYTVVDFGWDWRKHFFSAGQALAARIRAEASPSDPCAIVGHSAGGLVARAAWADLLASGQSTFVRRIVTMGSPHQGSYYGATILSGDGGPVIRQLQGASDLAFSLVGNDSPYAARTWSVRELQQLAGTWPILYDLLPVVGSEDAQQDPFRIRVFSATDWPAGRGVSQRWLDYSLNVVGPWMLSAASLPPSWVLTYLVGVGTPTASILSAPASLGETNAISLGDGDGVVTSSSARLLAAGVRAYADWSHADLPNLAARTGWLVPAVLDVRLPPDPPGPETHIVGQDIIGLYGPPFTSNMGGPLSSGSCVFRPCNC